MAKKECIQVDFVQHCDDPPCDLGYAIYTCSCGKNVIDYGDLWWDQHEPSKLIKSKCDSCKIIHTLKKLDYGEYKFLEDERND